MGKKVLILVNHDVVIYNFRRELVEELIKQKYKVYISCPYGERIELLKKMGCEYIPTDINRRSINPFVDLKLLIKYIWLVSKIKPGVVLTYTIKPNIYGSLAARCMHVPYLNNITGLGSTFQKENILSRILILLYKIALKKSHCVFFQNKENQELFIRKKVVGNNYKLIPGSGVNLEHFQLQNYPPEEKIHFLFIARVMKEKGIDQYLEAAEVIKKKYPNTEFHILGFCEEAYEKKLNEMQEQGIIQYHGMQKDVHSFIKICHAVILPSYHEGMANVLLEAASTGRPVLATNIPGCKETFNENISGFSFYVRDTNSLVDAIIKFIELPYERKKSMGLAGRRKMEMEFDRNIVVKAYLEEINGIYKENRYEFI